MDTAHAVSSSSDPSPDWAGHLEPGVVQLIGSKLGHPYVPGAVHLANICRAWRTAAAEMRDLSITWHSAVLGPYEQRDARSQKVQQAFTPWLSRFAHQLVSFEVVSKDDNSGGEDVAPLHVVLTAVAILAAEAGTPLPLQRFALPLTPFTDSWGLVTLVTVLPFLRQLSIPLDPQVMPEDLDALLEALGSLRHLSSLEVGLKIDAQHVSNEQILQCWEQLLEAAPKQLQQLSFQLPTLNDEYVNPVEVAYTFGPLAAFKQLQRLQLSEVAPECDLAPLATLPSLTSLGIKQKQAAAKFDSLVAVKGLLRDLQFEWCISMEGHVQQLTALTSLAMWAYLHSKDALPQQVAAGLQRLDWTLHDNGSSSSSGDSGSGSPVGRELAKCSTQLKELHLRGEAWAFDAAAAGDTLRQLTGLTSFGFYCMRTPGDPAPIMGTWPSHPPMQHMKQLRSLAVPVELLETDQPWLGGLPHLTGLQLAVEWSALTPAGAWGKEQVFGVDEAKVLANLTSCCSTLKVVEVDLVVLHGEELAPEAVLPLVPAVKAWFKRQLPGVHTLLSWRAQVDVSWEDMMDALMDASIGDPDEWEHDQALGIE